MEDFRRIFRQRGRGAGILALLVGLVDNGYALDQIVEEIFFFGATVEVDEGVIRIIDESGNRVEPKRSPQGVIAKPGASTCGNEVLDPFEQCDQDILAGQSCRSLDFADGELRCDPYCRFDASGCGPNCGNGVVDAGEDCDGRSLGGQTCEGLNFGGGTLACTTFCRWDTSGCIPPVCAAEGGSCCGPGSKSCGRTCIATDADCCDGGASRCESGTVCVEGGCCPRALPKSCGDRCIAAGASCCGNGSKETGEECDGADLGGASCEAGGSVRCDGACKLDRSGCELSCEPPSFACGAGCAPGGADCCGPIGYCDPGKVCSGPGNDQCCPADKPEICGDKCMPASNVCCGSFSCPAGDVCAGGAGSPACCPAAYPVFCGRQCFAPESVCCGDGACVPGAVCTDGLCGPP